MSALSGHVVTLYSQLIIVSAAVAFASGPEAPTAPSVAPPSDFAQMTACIRLAMQVALAGGTSDAEKRALAAESNKALFRYFLKNSKIVFPNALIYAFGHGFQTAGLSMRRVLKRTSFTRRSCSSFSRRASARTQLSRSLPQPQLQPVPVPVPVRQVPLKQLSLQWRSRTRRSWPRESRSTRRSLVCIIYSTHILYYTSGRTM